MDLITKKLYFILGFTFFIIGLLGYYLPILPGTIFLIISAYFFMHSSQKFYNKIVNNPYYGRTIKLYIEDNIISVKSKVIILLSIWIATFITISVNILTNFSFNFNILGLDLTLNVKTIAVLISAVGSIFVLRTKNN
tara:strand:+ start:19 stop:429 length:411 start_codon:yes stop_codon:yes gene_type:complete